MFSVWWTTLAALLVLLAVAYFVLAAPPRARLITAEPAHVIVQNAGKQGHT